MKPFSRRMIVALPMVTQLAAATANPLFLPTPPTLYLSPQKLGIKGCPKKVTYMKEYNAAENIFEFTPQGNPSIIKIWNGVTTKFEYSDNTLTKITTYSGRTPEASNIEEIGIVKKYNDQKMPELIAATLTTKNNIVMRVEGASASKITYNGQTTTINRLTKMVDEEIQQQTTKEITLPEHPTNNGSLKTYGVDIENEFKDSPDLESITIYSPMGIVFEKKRSGISRKYTYNDKYLESEMLLSDEKTEIPELIQYKTLTADEKGNWTKRALTITTPKGTDSNLETLRIEYHASCENGNISK